MDARKVGKYIIDERQFLEDDCFRRVNGKNCQICTRYATM